MENGVRNYDWCYVSGRVNILECSLLSSNFFERLLSNDDFKDVLTNLNNTPLKAYFTHAKHLYEFETLLDEYYCNRLYEIRSLSPDSAVCDFFLLRNDVHNLKRFMKSKILGASMDKFFQGTFSEDELDSAWQDKSTALPEIFRGSFLLIKKIIADNIGKRTPSYSTIQKEASLPLIIDLIFDGAYLRYIEDSCGKTEVEVIKKYLKTYQLVKGIEVIRRAMSLRLDMNLLNQYFLEGFEQNHLFRKLVINKVWTTEKKLRETLLETVKKLFAFKPSVGAIHELPLHASNLFPKVSFQYEVATDNYLLDMLRPVKYTPFGPERVFGYLCGLTTEIFNLKLVLGGKMHRIENNLLRERLRKTYV